MTAQSKNMFANIRKKLNRHLDFYLGTTVQHSAQTCCPDWETLRGQVWTPWASPPLVLSTAHPKANILFIVSLIAQRYASFSWKTRQKRRDKRESTTLVYGNLCSDSLLHLLCQSSVWLEERMNFAVLAALLTVNPAIDKLPQKAHITKTLVAISSFPYTSDGPQYKRNCGHRTLSSDHFSWVCSAYLFTMDSNLSGTDTLEEGERNRMEQNLKKK